MQQIGDGTARIVQPPASAWRAHAIDAACALFAALPLVLTTHIPLYDLPNHIAMLHVLLDGAANPTLAQIYGVHWAFVPNMGLQLFAWSLSPLLSVEVSARLFCITTILLLCAGTRALSLAFEADDTNPRLYRVAPLLVWGGPMQFGFVSYCFGCALMLFALTLYLRLRHRRAVLIVAVFAPVCIVLLATHLMALGLFLGAVAGLELTEAFRQQTPLSSRLHLLAGRAALTLSLVVPALAVLLMAPPLMRTAAPSFNEAPIDNFSLLYKAEAVAAITWFAMPAVEIPLLLLAASCAGLALLLGWIRPDRKMVGIAAVLGLVSLAMPRGFTAAFYMDYRMPWAICFIVLAGLGQGASTGRHRAGKARSAMACALAALVGVRIASISLHWLKCEPELAAIDHALARLREGTSLWLVKGTLPGQLMKAPPIEHAAAYIVSRRNGFESEVFAGAAGQIVFLKPHYLPLYRMTPASDLLSVPAGCDAVLVLYPALVKRTAGLGLHEVASGQHFQVLSRDGVSQPAVGSTASR